MASWPAGGNCWPTEAALGGGGLCFSAAPKDSSRSPTGCLTEASCPAEVRDKKTREGQRAKDAHAISPTREMAESDSGAGGTVPRPRVGPKGTAPNSVARGQGSGWQRVCHHWTRGSPSFTGSRLPEEVGKLARAEQQALRQPREPPGCFLCSWEPRGPPQNRPRVNRHWSPWL